MIACLRQSDVLSPADNTSAGNSNKLFASAQLQIAFYTKRESERVKLSKLPQESAPFQAQEATRNVLVRAKKQREMLHNT